MPDDGSFFKNSRIAYEQTRDQQIAYDYAALLHNNYRTHNEAIKLLSGYYHKPISIKREDKQC